MFSAINRKSSSMTLHVCITDRVMTILDRVILLPIRIPIRGAVLTAIVKKLRVNTLTIERVTARSIIRIREIIGIYWMNSLKNSKKYSKDRRKLHRRHSKGSKKKTSLVEALTDMNKVRKMSTNSRRKKKEGGSNKIIRNSKSTSIDSGRTITNTLLTLGTL